MPFTPFHFGLGIFAKSLLPKRVSLTVFILVQVVIDFEVLVNMITPSQRLHGFFHSFIGSSIVAVAVCLIVIAAYKFLKISDRPFSFSELLLSALMGSSSHTFLDSIMHKDLMPFEPLSSSNPWLDLISVVDLHISLVVMGALGGAIMIFYNVYGLHKRRNGQP